MAGVGIGYEETPTNTFSNIVSVMHEARRVLKDTGTFWIVAGKDPILPANRIVEATDARTRKGAQDGAEASRVCSRRASKVVTDQPAIS